MIWRRLKKSTPEQEREFEERMTEEKPSFKEKVTMVLTAYAVLLVPAALILIAFSLLVCWIFGIL